METAFTRWINEKLKTLLQIDKEELSNIVEYIASLEDVEEVSSFVEDILYGCSDSQFKKLKTTKERFRFVQVKYIMCCVKKTIVLTLYTITFKTNFKKLTVYYKYSNVYEFVSLTLYKLTKHIIFKNNITHSSITGFRG